MHRTHQIGHFEEKYFMIWAGRDPGTLGLEREVKFEVDSPGLYRTWWIIQGAAHGTVECAVDITVCSGLHKQLFVHIK